MEKAIVQEISGDIRLSGYERFRDLLQDARRNFAGVRQRPPSHVFRPNFARAATIAVGQSPGRLLTELFIETELPRLLPPREVEMAEIGCGAGSCHRLMP